MNSENSSDELRQGMTRFVLPLAPLLDSFFPEVQPDEAHL
jgi:hypothetical protein